MESLFYSRNGVGEDVRDGAVVQFERLLMILGLHLNASYMGSLFALIVRASGCKRLEWAKTVSRNPMATLAVLIFG